MYLHFVDPSDNSIMDVDNVLKLIDKNIDYLDQLYKDFNVLVSEVRSDFLIIRGNFFESLTLVCSSFKTV